MVLGDRDKQLVILFGVANEGIFHPDTFDYQESDISAKISCIGVNRDLVNFEDDHNPGKFGHALFSVHIRYKVTEMDTIQTKQISEAHIDTNSSAPLADHPQAQLGTRKRLDRPKSN